MLSLVLAALGVATPKEAACAGSTRTVRFIGAPFIEGQNLDGADRAPAAIREAGLARAVRALGHAFEDAGDLDFEAAYAARGLRAGAHETLDRYRQWVKGGMKSNFAEWSAGVEVDDPHAAGRTINNATLGVGLKVVHDAVAAAAAAGEFPLVIGGDHSVAAGSIAAAAAAHPGLAVLWVDAHADANTPTSSLSGNFHGMPAACLLGWFDALPPGFDEWMPAAGCLAEEQLAYIGLRDVDPAERAALRSSKVAAFSMREVDRHGIARVVELALAAIDPKGERPLWLSLDVDSVDPHFAPGTGTMARGGLSYRESHYVLEELALSGRLVGMDLVEVNPQLEEEHHAVDVMHGDDPDVRASSATVLLAVELILSALGKSIL